MKCHEQLAQHNWRVVLDVDATIVDIVRKTLYGANAKHQDDAAQETRMKLARSPTFQGIETQAGREAFARHVGRNQCRTILRSVRAEEQKRPSLTTNEMSMTELRIATEVWQVIQALPSRYRIPLTLRFEDEMSAAYIAKELGLHPRRVNTVIREGLEIVRGRMRDVVRRTSDRARQSRQDRSQCEAREPRHLDHQ